jgi:ribosomal protein S18 acetylase RimI-like enzyme
MTKLVEDFWQTADELKARHLSGRKYWYLNVIARNPDSDVSGVARALIQPYLEKAAEEGLPAYLEATNEHAKNVYEHMGFKVVERVLVGKDLADERGNKVGKGGSGFYFWAMIAEPPASSIA